jgi:hypothetical protein
MSAGSVSLTSSINICRVGSGEAPRIESDRFLNPNNMVCPIWNGTNLKGQEVCADSFYTKSAGCNSALDRVLVESDLRPDYASYVTLNMAGVKGEMFGNPSARAQVNARTRMLKNIENTEPNFGRQIGGFRRSSGSCSINAYEGAMAQEAQTNRQRVALTNYANARANRG